MKVWKYPVPLQGEPIELLMPAGARVLDVQIQEENDPENAQLWALVDTWALDRVPRDQRRFEWVGTSHNVETNNDGSDLKHVKTVQFGAYVFHLFERIR